MTPTGSFLRGTVAKRILGLFLACALLPVGSLAVLSLREMSGQLRRQANQRMRHDSKRVDQAMHQGLSLLHTEMKALGLSAPVPRDRHFLGLTRFREGYGPKTYFGMPCPPPPRLDGLEKHLLSGEAAIFVREIPGAVSRVYMAISLGRKIPGPGLLVGEIHPQYLREVIENALPADGDLAVLDSAGTPFYAPRPLPAEVARKVGDALTGTHAGQFEWNRGDDAFLVEYRSIFLGAAYLSGDWTIVLSRAKANAFAPLRTFTRTFVLVVALTLLVVLLLSIVQIRRTLVPLAKLREGARRIGEGDFTSGIEIESGDEFEELARSFTAMTDRMGTQFRKLQETNLRLEQEIAERKQTEKEKTLLTMAVEQAAETILVTDIEGKIQYINRAFEQVSGYSREETVGRRFDRLFGGEAEQERYRAMWDALEQGKTWTGQTEGRRKDGTRFEEMTVVAPVRNADGRVVNYVAAKRDVTSERSMEEQLRQSQKMEAIGILTGGIAHDFNNILTVIHGYGSLLLRKVGAEDPVRKEIGEILNAGERGASLVRQLLAFSRKQVVEPKVVNLDRVISGIGGMLHRLIGETVRLTTAQAEDLWSVRVDPGQIEQVVVNLVINARDAMPNGGDLVIETANRSIDDATAGASPVERPGEYVMLRVSDTGCGMSESVRSRVYEPFFTTKLPGKGTGLGLSTVYGIVKQNGGAIHLESEEGKGTIFSVYFPRSDRSSEERHSSDRSSESDCRGTETLMLAEDEDSVRDLVRVILTGQGYTVLEARDGRESLAIGSTHEGPIPLLVTDMRMPYLDGRELSKRLAEVRPGIKTLYMSGYMEEVESGGSPPVDEAIFIRKPFLPEALARKVREILDGKEGEEKGR